MILDAALPLALLVRIIVWVIRKKRHLATKFRHFLLRALEMTHSFPCHKSDIINSGKFLGKMAGVTGLEPAASGVTGRRSNQLSYTPAVRPCFIGGGPRCQAT